MPEPIAEKSEPVAAGAPLEKWEPRIIAFLCYWCSYAGADAAGTLRLKYPPNILIVRVMCSGRVDPELITGAFARGADGVLVCGCQIGCCHYISGNHKTMARMPLLGRVLVEMVVEPGRFRHEWVSASEGEKFARITNEITEVVRRLGPLNWPGRLHVRGVGHGSDLEAWETPQ